MIPQIPKTSFSLSISVGTYGSAVSHTCVISSTIFPLGSFISHTVLQKLSSSSALLIYCPGLIYSIWPLLPEILLIPDIFVRVGLFLRARYPPKLVRFISPSKLVNWFLSTLKLLPTLVNELKPSRFVSWLSCR